ncbi:hypothetical protein EGW08_020824 [Elysia chlorotica]|uniref:Major facilitator superfamily (MFS) profile domain-containing protein n=1 Tax=Elysia chlorotica TaxID=188477 RepID=A0A3S1B405_ELYCH|nr:hypothetical protein EGW08_020824 [Elysia chlorotica]
MDKDSGTSKLPIVLPIIDPILSFLSEEDGGGEGGETGGPNNTKPTEKTRDEESDPGLEGDHFTSIWNLEENNRSENVGEVVEDGHILEKEKNGGEISEVPGLDMGNRKIKTGVGTDDIHRASQNICDTDVIKLNQIHLETVADFVLNTTSCCADTPLHVENHKAKEREYIYSQNGENTKCQSDYVFEDCMNRSVFDGDHTSNQNTLVEDGKGDDSLSGNTDGKLLESSCADETDQDLKSNDESDSKSIGVDASVVKSGSSGSSSSNSTNTDDNSHKTTGANDEIDIHDPHSYGFKPSDGVGLDRESPISYENFPESHETVRNATHVINEDCCSSEHDPNLNDGNIGSSKLKDETHDAPKSTDVVGGISHPSDFECKSCKPVGASGAVSGSADVDISGTSDNHQENFAKVVTFSEDKEVFDMGYVVPASVTVHLDTPVSSITPRDVQISAEIVDPVCVSAANPISGILKTDDVGDHKEDNYQQCAKNDPALVNSVGFEDAAHSSAKIEQEGSPIDKLYIEGKLVRNRNAGGVACPDLDVSIENKGKAHSAISDSTKDREGCTSTSDDLSNEGTSKTSAGDSSNFIKGEDGVSTATSARPIAEEDEGAGHREFVVEAVPEGELLQGVEAAASGATPPSTPGKQLNGASSAQTPVDAVSHSTDSNYQDTIGPLDNPQFLKTLNYTASQAFDQDEHFGLHSGCLDARSLIGLQDPTDLDGGWAWVVLIASFLGATLLGASVYSAGVLMKAILDEVEDDLTKASWVGSVFVCVMSLSGPFVGSALSRFGARCTVSCAGIVLALGFVGASLSSSIEQLILTHGVLAGLGAGFTVNPLFVTVGQYFNRYRGFACGVLAMGAGAGMLTGGAFVSYLLTLFDLKGTYLIWAGIMLHVTPVGLLLRPSPEERVRTLERDQNIGAYTSQPDLVSTASGPNSLFGSVNHSMLSGIDRISTNAYGRRVLVPDSLGFKRPNKLMMTAEPSHTGSTVDTPLLKSALHNDLSRSSHSVNRVVQSKSTLNKSISDVDNLFSSVTSKPLTYEAHEQFVSNAGTRSASQNQLASSSNWSPSSNTLNSLAMTSPSPYSRHHSVFTRPGSVSQYVSTSHISAQFSFRSALTAPRGELDNESVTSAFVSNLRPHDSVYPRHPLGSRSMSTMLGSVASFPTSLAIVKDDLRRFEPPKPYEYDGTLKGHIIALLDSLRILRNKPFCIFVLTNFFWALGESPVLIHLPSYVVSRGTTQMQASSLYTSMGIASMAGRFLSGLIASDVNIGPVLIYTGSLGLAGMVIIFSPLMTQTFGQQIVFSFLVGLYTGALVPLTSLITIELLGLGELSLGFGLISMSQGIGYLIGPPLSSVMVKTVGFVKAFVLSGFVLLGGSILALCMTMVLLTTEDADGDEDADLEGQEDKEEHPLRDLQRALQKIDHDSSCSDLDNEGQENNSEKKRTNTGDGSCVADESAWTASLISLTNSVHSKTRSHEDFAVVDAQEDVGAGNYGSADEYPRTSSALTSPSKEDNKSTPVRVFDELDTIVEVLGK